MTRVVIFGVSGHAKVIVDIIENQTDLELIGLIDNFASKDTKVLGYSVLGNDASLHDFMQKLDFLAPLEFFPPLLFHYLKQGGGGVKTQGYQLISRVFQRNW